MQMPRDAIGVLFTTVVNHCARQEEFPSFQHREAPQPHSLWLDTVCPIKKKKKKRGGLGGGA